jgi:hypothetical protein
MKRKNRFTLEHEIHYFGKSHIFWANRLFYVKPSRPIGRLP